MKMVVTVLIRMPLGKLRLLMNDVIGYVGTLVGNGSYFTMENIRNVRIGDPGRLVDGPGIYFKAGDLRFLSLLSTLAAESAAKSSSPKTR